MKYKYRLSLHITSLALILILTACPSVSPKPGNLQPVADLVFMPSLPSTTQEVHFDATDSTDDKGIVKYLFDFGDGSDTVEGSSATADHMYETAGTYTAIVTVMDAEGERDSAEVTVVVHEAKVCRGSFVIDGEDTQADIDLVEGCTEIIGSLDIYDTDLTDLSFLSRLEKVTYRLSIGISGRDGSGPIGNDSLTSLEGLGNLTTVDRTLAVYDNDALINLDGLRNLVSVETLAVSFNDTLVNLQGLDSFSTVENIIVSKSQALKNLRGLEKITTATRVTLYANDALLDLDGLDSIVSITHTLNLTHNRALVNLHGLSSLTSIGNFSITNCESLESVDGVENLTTAGTLNFIANHALVSLQALRSLTKLTGDLRIGSTPALPNLDGLDALQSIDGYLHISAGWGLQSISGLNNLQVVGGTKAIGGNLNFDCTPYNENPPPYFPLTSSSLNRVNCLIASSSASSSASSFE